MRFSSKPRERFFSPDWLLLLAVLGIMLFGAAFIYSASAAAESNLALPWYKQFYAKQIIWYGFGLGAAILVNLVDYHVLTRWAMVAYWGTIALLIFVLLFGKEVYGAKRWISLGLFQLQPSEFSKIAVILALGQFLSRPVDELRLPGNFFKALGMTLLPFILILKEPDLGSALVLLPVCLVMLFVAGTPVKYLARLVGIFSLLAALFLVDVLFAPPQWQIKLQDYQRHRLLVFFGKDFAPPNATEEEKAYYRRLQRDKSYNVEQALISVGSGGLMGKGWRQGKQNALGFPAPGSGSQ